MELLKYEAIEAHKEKLIQDPSIRAFFDKLDQVRELGVEGFQARLEDLLGKMLSAAKPHQKYVFFEVLLQSISTSQWNNFFTEFFETQARHLLEKSTYRKRAEAILDNWNLTIRCGLNFPGWMDVKMQRVQHLEMLAEALEHPAFVLQSEKSVNIYEDGSLKKAIDLIVATGIRQIFGWNGFLDDLKLLQKDLEHNIVALNLSVFFNSHQQQSPLIRALVLRVNKLESKINEIEEATAAHNLDQLTQVYNLQVKVEKLQSSEVLKDKLQSEVVPRLSRQNSRLHQKNAEIAPALADALKEIEELREENKSLRSQLKTEKRAKLAAEQALEEERQHSQLLEQQYNELADEDTESLSLTPNPLYSLGHFSGKKVAKELFQEKDPQVVITAK